MSGLGLDWGWMYVVRGLHDELRFCSSYTLGNEGMQEEQGLFVMSNEFWRLRNSRMDGNGV